MRGRPSKEKARARRALGSCSRNGDLPRQRKPAAAAAVTVTSLLPPVGKGGPAMGRSIGHPSGMTGDGGSGEGRRQSRRGLIFNWSDQGESKFRLTRHAGEPERFADFFKFRVDLRVGQDRSIVAEFQQCPRAIGNGFSRPRKNLRNFLLARIVEPSNRIIWLW